MVEGVRCCRENQAWIYYVWWVEGKEQKWGAITARQQGAEASSVLDARCKVIGQVWGCQELIEKIRFE